MIGDLHCHTRLSDGSMSIDDVVFYARRAGLQFLSVTDHDTMDGVTRAAVLGKRYGIRVIPGVELSCRDSQRDMEVHILCYLPDFPDRLVGLMKQSLESRMAAGEEMLAKAARCFPVTRHFIQRYSGSSKAVYPVHIMQGLMDLGYADESHGPLFRQLFHPQEGSCAVSPAFCDVRAVLEQVRIAGGIGVLAHPGVSGCTALLEELAEGRLIQGVEVYHPDHSQADVADLSELARRYRFLETGGSDFHGSLSPNARPLATCATPEASIHAMFRLKNVVAAS